jgi:hypothetical protein
VLAQGSMGRRIGVLGATVFVSTVVACDSTPTDGDSRGRDDRGERVNQTYWYCWDDGHGEPHHLGHPVTGDHLCTDQELEDGY